MKGACHSTAAHCAPASHASARPLALGRLLKFAHPRVHKERQQEEAATRVQATYRGMTGRRRVSTSSRQGYAVHRTGALALVSSRCANGLDQKGETMLANQSPALFRQRARRQRCQTSPSAALASSPQPPGRASEGLPLRGWP